MTITSAPDLLALIGGGITVQSIIIFIVSVLVGLGVSSSAFASQGPIFFTPKDRLQELIVLARNDPRIAQQNRSRADGPSSGPILPIGKSTAYFQGLVEEAQAEVELYASRVAMARSLVEKAVIENKYAKKLFERTDSLLKKDAVAITTWDEHSSRVEQSIVDIALLEAHLLKEEGELKAAQARLKQAIALLHENNPPPDDNDQPAKVS